jgi:hypothetical protein
MAAKVTLRTKPDAVRAVASHAADYLQAMSMDEILDQLAIGRNAGRAEVARIAHAVEQVTSRLRKMGGAPSDDIRVLLAEVADEAERTKDDVVPLYRSKTGRVL